MKTDCEENLTATLKPSRAWFLAAETLASKAALERAPRERRAKSSRSLQTQTGSVWSIWAAAKAEPWVEKLLLLLVAGAALAAIGYGFWQVLELVQNWAAFNQGLGQLAR